MYKKGFTLIELIMVIAIIAILSAVVFTSVKTARQKAFYARALSEYNSMSMALTFYQADNENEYPPDVSRDIPPGLGKYLAGENSDNWPNAPWPGSVYDWENWVDPSDSDKKIYQISIRFCPVGGQITQCVFPKEEWAKNFGVNSSVYYCIQGACRSHIDEPINYPGYCVNCKK